MVETGTNSKIVKSVISISAVDVINIITVVGVISSHMADVTDSMVLFITNVVLW